MKADKVQDTGNPTGHGKPEDWPKYIADQGWENYTSEEHGVWKTLFERQSEIVKAALARNIWMVLLRWKCTKHKSPISKNPAKS